MRQLVTILLSGCLAVACGGKKGGTTPSGGGGDDQVDEGGGGMSVEDPCEGGMCPPEVMDEIGRSLERKRRPAARCLADAINEGKVKRTAKGNVALSFVIGTNGKAHSIKVTNSTINNADIEKCVADVVASIDFPHPPRDLDWSYTYAFDSL